MAVSGFDNSEVSKACPNCELDVSKEDGIYNLIVHNVRLGEDQDYECQVSPGKTGRSPPLRAKAHITIQGKNSACQFKQMGLGSSFYIIDLDK